MTTRTARRSAAAAIIASLLVAALPGAATARSRGEWVPNSATRWENGTSGDDFLTAYAPTEKRPPFIGGGHLGTGDSDGPWLEWVTKISDLPSGIFLMSGIAVVDGIVYTGGGATNSFLALNAKTGLPVWRFAPDPRTDSYGTSYPGNNAPTVKNGVVYTSFANGWVYALNAKTGRKIWSFQATDGYQDTSARTNPKNESEELDSPYRPESWLRNRSDFGPVHPMAVYPKIHGRTAICEGKIIVMSLAGWTYAIDARTGKLSWKKMADGPEWPGELVWPEYRVGGALNPANSSAGMSTRRFEAVPGPGCQHGEVQVTGADGHVRFLDPSTGKDSTQGGDVGPVFDRVDGTNDFCVSAGFNCDIAVGLADPSSGDYIVTTLDSRIIRFDWRTHRVEWRRQYNAPLPLEEAGTLPIVTPHVEQGFITQAVVGAPMVFDPKRRLLYAADQDGHVYVLGIPDEAPNEDHQSASCPPGYTSLRPEGAVDPDNPTTSTPEAEPCFIARFGVSPNRDQATQYTRRGIGGPWDYNQMALGGTVLGGDVLYVPSWDNKINAFDVRDPRAAKKIWEHEIKWNDTFRYPPFGEAHKTPFADLDDKVFSSAALLGGHLYIAANDGSIYAFNLQRRVKTVRNLVILGSGAVPFLPELKQRLGAFDRVWTTDDWYKNQVPPAGYRFPKAAGVATASSLALGAAAAWWWVRRREDLLAEIEEGSE
ncbi:MAG: PQQ-binding-like beta-propeller repeat protein [Acidobacteria bacterium]|nr:PQQ-binding-like beta-propeller repeat protein [Acidobacteriota bacterium]